MHYANKTLASFYAECTLSTQPIIFKRSSFPHRLPISPRARGDVAATTTFLRHHSIRLFVFSPEI